MSAFLRRGVVAGLFAGLVAGLFLTLVGEPWIERALRFEVVAPGEASVELFSRTLQRLGLVAGTTLYGSALGGIFGFLYSFLTRSGSAWERSVKLAAAGFLGGWLVPFLKYPANPPAVGDPATIGRRSTLYVVMIAISVGVLIAAWIGARVLETRGVAAHVRQPVVVVGYVVVIATAYLLLPPNPDEITIPAKLLWGARMTSVAGQALLWSVLGAAFGALALRSERTRHPHKEERPAKVAA